MKTFKVTLTIKAEMKSMAEQFLNTFTGKETDLEIKEIKEVIEILHKGKIHYAEVFGKAVIE